MATQDGSERLDTIIARFKEEDFTVSSDNVVLLGENKDRIGLFAEHKTATNYETGNAKRVFYLEGSPWEMGYAMGYLAANDVQLMTTKYIDYAIWEMVTGAPPREGANSASPAERDAHDFLIDLLYKMLTKEDAIAAAPPAIKEEVLGLVAGCADSPVFRKGKEKDKVKIEEKDIWVLNAGFDCLLAHLYALRLPKLRDPKMRKLLASSIGCNSLALINGAAKDGPLFGRDFMFPTGGIFQELACMTIYNPISDEHPSLLPMVSMHAPGMVGSIAAMNNCGVAAGVDVIRGANSNPDDLGVNSLLLVRHAIGNSPSVDKAVDTIVDTPRGVTWLYPIAGAGSNGEKDQACVVEAGMTTNTIDFLSYPRDTMKKFMPSEKFLKDHQSTPQRKGAMVRNEEFEVPPEYISRYNPAFWKVMHKKMVPDAFTRLGYINRTHQEENCPKAYYFAPVRALKHKVVIASNHCVCPEMRLCSMDSWTGKLSGQAANDSQWRYDELNHQTLVALQSGAISYAKAKELIDYLSPYRKFPHYHAKNPKSTDGREMVIGGSVSLFDLKRRTVESHFGYYCDDWIKLTLPKYVSQE